MNSVVNSIVENLHNLSVRYSYTFGRQLYFLLGRNMTSTEQIKEIEKTLNETAEHFVRGFNKIQRLIESLKGKE